MTKRDDIQGRLDAIRERTAQADRLGEEYEAQYRELRDEIAADLMLQEQLNQRAEVRGARLAKLEELTQVMHAENEAIRRELADIKRAADGLPPIEVAQA